MYPCKKTSQGIATYKDSVTIFIGCIYYPHLYI